MDETAALALLQELVSARGPSGQEDEVTAIAQRELAPLCDSVMLDAAGNLVGKIDGPPSDAPAVRVMAHLDELALMVKTINDDSSLRVVPLGGIRPYKYGEGAVEILADEAILPGILSFGSSHVPGRTNKVLQDLQAKGGGEEMWNNVYVTTRLSNEETRERGVHPGTRVVVARSRRELFRVRDCVGGYFMDDRAGMLILLLTARLLTSDAGRPASDVYLVMTSNEELGAFGGVYASRSLPGDVALAVDVAPVAKVHGIELTPQPVIVYGDARSTYDKRVADGMLACGRRLGMDPQCATVSNYGSDASLSRSYGQTAGAGLLCIATDNTHGFEVVSVEGLTRCAELLAGYLASPSGRR